MLQFPAFTPCLMWCAPFCLHDSSSGAAMQIQLMFEQLVKRGVRVHVLSALIFDSPNGSAPFVNLDEQLGTQLDAKCVSIAKDNLRFALEYDLQVSNNRTTHGVMGIVEFKF